MLADHDITTDELFAVGATFTLVAWAFAYVFTVVQAIEPGSFTAAVDPGDDRTWMELLFLSFTTLTSTGLSDVVPVKAFARSVVMIEQLAGLGYVALVVSRLVGLLVLGQRGPRRLGWRAQWPRSSTTRSRSSSSSWWWRRSRSATRATRPTT